MYKRVLLKLSGEALLGPCQNLDSSEILQGIVLSIKEISEAGVQIGIVIGGGNLCRGVQAGSKGMNRIAADRIGMMATLVNGLILQQSFAENGCQAQVLSSLQCGNFLEDYQHDKAIDSLENGSIVIFTGGTGLPYFSTDTAAALRAVEIKADILLKATKVDGIYDKDPQKFSDATRYQKITYSQVLKEQLGVMDLTAMALCMEHHLPLLVFDIFAKNSLKQAVFSQNIGTLVSE